MSNEPDQYPPPASKDRSPIAVGFATAVALVIACFGVLLRAKLNFSTTLAPSMDAAYYPMQAWWLLEHGRPMYDDVPFFFIVNAIAGKAIALATGMDLGDALMLASRWIDCIVPPLIAVPIVLLAHRWSDGRRAGLAVGAAVAAAAVANPLTIRMLGDFQKNSMALVFLACAAWAVARAASMPAARGVVARFWPLALFSGLCAFTHVGGFGAAAVMLGVTALAWFVLSGRFTPRKLALGLAVVVVAGGLAFAIIAVFAPDRASELLDAPRKIFQGSGDAGGMRGGGPMGGPMGGPPGGGEGGGTVIVYAVAILALLRAAFDRSISAGERALGIGLACCAMLLSFPLLAREYAMRFSLMAFAPAALAAVFVLAPVVRRPRAWPVGVACAFGIAAVAITPVVRGISGSSDGGAPRGPDALLKGPVIPDGSDAELIAMRSLIANPAKTLVVARHGLQWWAGHLLHTPVRNTVPDDAFTKYERVLRLVEVGRGGGPGGRMGPDGFDGMDGPPGPPGFGGPDGPRAPRRDQSVDAPMGRPRPADAPRAPTERPPSDGARDDASGADRARGTTVIYRGKSFELIEVRAAGS